MERLAQEAHQHKRVSESMESQGETEKSKSDKHNPNRPKKQTKSANTSLNSSTERESFDKKMKKKGQKLYCVCRTPYDKSKYVLMVVLKLVLYLLINGFSI